MDNSPDTALCITLVKDALDSLSVSQVTLVELGLAIS